MNYQSMVTLQILEKMKIPRSILLIVIFLLVDIKGQARIYYMLRKLLKVLLTVPTQPRTQLTKKFQLKVIPIAWLVHGGQLI